MGNDHMTVEVIFRPQWTCGRYDKSSHSAIMFNLLEGRSFFFEDESADLVGVILNFPRNTSVSLDQISTICGIDRATLEPFIKILISKGLLSPIQIKEEHIQEYRKAIYLTRKQQTNDFTASSRSKEFLLSNNSSAEKSYAARTGIRVTTVLIELTYQCSEMCVHCYNPGATRNNIEKSTRNTFQKLNLEDYYRIIDELYEEGAVRICLSGGDPFSNPFIWQIIQRLYEKEIAIEIFTNGLNLVNKEEILAKFFPCVVGISIYSPIPEIHDSITRIRGSFEKSTSVLRKLSELGIVLEVKCCLMQQNLKSYLGVKKIAFDCNATFQMECSIFDSADGDSSITRYLRLSEEQLEVVLRDVDNPLYVGPELNDYGAEEKNLEDIGCKAGIAGMAISPDGSLIPCASFHASLGNLKENTLHELLHNNPRLEWWAEQKLSKYEECGKHDYCSFCKLCPGLNFSEHGTPLKASENNCFAAKVRHNLANKLKRGEDPLSGRTLSEALENLTLKDISQIKRDVQTNNFNKPINQQNHENYT